MVIIQRPEIHSSLRRIRDLTWCAAGGKEKFAKAISIALLIHKLPGSCIYGSDACGKDQINIGWRKFKEDAFF
jgi:hypothetical protein